MQMPPDKKTIIPPEGGWRARTYYAVAVAVNRSNPVWGAIFYSGFLNGLGETPGGYAEVWSGCSDAIAYGDLYYLEALHVLDVPEPAEQARSPRELPQEVQKIIEWTWGMDKAAEPDEFHCVPKSAMSRGEAWQMIRPEHATSPKNNPWRKLHSKNYWVWYLKKEAGE